MISHTLWAHLLCTKGWAMFTYTYLRDYSFLLVLTALSGFSTGGGFTHLLQGSLLSVCGKGLYSLYTQSGSACDP